MSERLDPYPISNEIVDLAPELFKSADDRVISYKGVNYYKTCGEVVYEKRDGSTSHCVLRMHHPYPDHEDYEGRHRMMEWVADYDQEVRERFRTVLKRSGLDDTQIFNALNALQMAGLILAVKLEA